MANAQTTPAILFMVPRFGPPPDPAIRYVTRPGAYAVILAPRGRLLITWQGPPHDEFQLPGGGIDPGESPLAALHREVMEETGWRISVIARLGAYQQFKFMPEYGFHARKLCRLFLARAVRRVGPPTETGHVPHFLTPDEAARHVASPGDRAFLRAVMAQGWRI